METESDSATECGGDEEEGGRPGLISSSSVAQDVRWRHLVCSLKWKSFKRFSTVPLVAGYEMSRKSLMRRLGKHHVSEEMVDGVRWTVPKPSWRNFTFDELSAATGGFSLGKFLRNITVYAFAAK
ncbi:putative non-specific serine/threonine protein kinase [Helianthus annuus]|nr:putative non-specific serine/threonine protein kinase [Helianthus annuus]